ncbi:cytochrome P450 [Amycolatopsis rhabdoformis]|uniref:Cytochrome P450 n=1 Tax=Amycolatopsis rhabdoformis TaxID=1448059 RepID=A0ABZ1IFQ6_9PSEU|nr:cytochrome P450 [Amycolatopsis rhabdoformis]WSE32493.1 cytochrome P450 [Amycolatopsis rhabdoformis]
MPTLDSSVAESVSLEDLWQDPYPIYRRLRAESPVAWVPAAGRFMVTGYAEVVALDKHPEIFSANETNSLMHRSMGHTMLRKDGAVHRRERKAAESAVRPRMVSTHWLPIFQRIADELIDGFHARGEADLFRDFAAPLASLSLGAVLGLTRSTADELAGWSQDMMNGTSNYGDDPGVWARSDQARDAVSAAVDEAAARLRREPDGSAISSMINADDPLSPEEVRANARLFISGGLNEPRDATATTTYALLSDPSQRALVEADPTRFAAAFEESIRWVSPISMYPRMTTQDTELGGVAVPAGSRIGVMVGAANRDEKVFTDPDRFDLARENRTHVAFGGGPHFCLGSWVARSQVGQVALPTLFRRLRNLRLDEHRPVRMGGWVFRGVLDLPVRWDV